MEENEKMDWKGASNRINPGENNFQEGSIVIGIANTIFFFLTSHSLKNLSSNSQVIFLMLCKEFLFKLRVTNVVIQITCEVFGNLSFNLDFSSNFIN